MTDESKTAVGGAGKKQTSKTTAEKAKKPRKKPEHKTPREKPTKRHRELPVKRPQDRQVSGIEKLRLVADDRLFKIAGTVVQKLVENARAGKLDSARFLVALADKKPGNKRDEEVNPDSTAWILKLAAEPEFRDLAQSALDAAPVAKHEKN